MNALTCPFCLEVVADTVTSCPRCGAEYGVLPGGISKARVEAWRTRHRRAARTSLFLTIACLAADGFLRHHARGAMGWVDIGSVILGVFTAGWFVFSLGCAVRFGVAAQLAPTWHQVMKSTECDPPSGG